MSAKHPIEEQSRMSTETLSPPPTSPLPEEPAPTGPPRAGTGVRPSRTTIPVRSADPEPTEVRRSTATIRHTDLYAAIGAAVAALSLTALVYTQLAPFDGVLGFVVLAYVAFLGFYSLLVSFDEDGPAVRDRVVGALVHSVGFLLLAVLLLVIFYTLARGWSAMVHLNFFTQDMSVTSPLAPLDEGGVLHGIAGTLEQITLALLLTVPLAVICAVFLNEIPGRFSRTVRTIAEAMTALPSIVAGLFVYATLILSLGYDRSGFAAALAISVMMLPIIIRASDVVIRLVPGNLREAALALGASQWRTVWHVVLPTARSGLTTAVILGTARGIGETSPVLLTAGGADAVNLNPFQDWQNSLPLVTYKSVAQPSDNMVARGFGTAATLMLLVLLLFILARLIGGRGPGQLTRRQQRRRTRQSAQDQARYARRDQPRTDIFDLSPAVDEPAGAGRNSPTDPAVSRTDSEDRNA
ncbi:phosphate ABC transporter permease PstA [Micromonospora sp. NPDC050397]|uniref:phosphate ABC transporter permease PstA n=1 Tax=Micromonospora sp. NPDC050397 TaxID=3364279 RepID=UPI00384EFB26